MRLDDRAVSLPAGEGARVLALGLLDEADETAARLANGQDDEALHDFRVALRRLRSTLRALRPWLRGSVKRRDEKKLQKVATSTNQARDAEVQLAWLATQRETLAAGRHRAGYDLVVGRFEGRARGEPDAGRAAERYGRVAKKLRRRLRTYERGVEPGDGGPTFGAVLASLLDDQVGALRRRMDAVAGPSDEEGVHRARIEGKRLRYLLEPLRGHRGADATGPVRHLRRLQDLLGELHDAHVLAGELREALVEAAVERARAQHAAVYGAVTRVAAGRPPPSSRPGILALTRRVRERRDALYAHLERERRSRGVEALAAEVHEAATPLRSSPGASPRRSALHP